MALSAASSGREMTTPEGLFGELRMSSAVFSVTAAESASRSSAKVSALHGHDAHAAARRLGIDGILREIRCEHDGLVPRAEERACQDRQRTRRAVGHVDILRAVRLAERLREVGRDLFTHRCHARCGRIGVQLRGRHGMQQMLDGRVHTVRRVDARAADGKVIDVFRADLGRAALAVGRDSRMELPFAPQSMSCFEIMRLPPPDTA